MDMARLERPGSARVAPIDVASAGQHMIRYGLVLVLLWIGGMKFTAYEAQGIKGLVENSPLLSWAYAVLSAQGFSNLIGVTEVLIGLLIAAASLAPLGDGRGDAANHARAAHRKAVRRPDGRAERHAS
jgi:Protein of unknown function, DUF417